MKVPGKYKDPIVQKRDGNLYLTPGNRDRFKRAVNTRITSLTRAQIIKWANKRGKVLDTPLTIEGALAEMVAIMDWLSDNGLSVDKDGCVMLRGKERA